MLRRKEKTNVKMLEAVIDRQKERNKKELNKQKKDVNFLDNLDDERLGSYGTYKKKYEVDALQSTFIDCENDRDITKKKVV